MTPQPQTPLPWGISKAVRSSVVSLAAERGIVIDFCQRDADAAFIVHACNSHAALTEEVGRLTAERDALRAALKETLAAFQESVENDIPPNPRVFARARAALSTPREET